MPNIYPTATDVIAVVNYINARGSGAVPWTAAGPPYVDVTGDNYVAADDVITIINYINAHPEQMIGQTEAMADEGHDELAMLLVMDVAGQGKRKL
jgi:hypothetical protein